MASLKKITLLGVYMLFSSFFVAAQTEEITARIEEAMTQFTQHEQLDHALTSLSVLHAETGEPVFLLNEEIGLAPASTLKNSTAATAYFKLGPDFQYQTKLLHSGHIENGTLDGDIIIQGSGDPTLGSWRYEDTKPEIVLTKWINAIKEAGIKTIKGRIVGDGSLFDSQTTPDGWTWQDMGNYYGAGTSGLTWHENQYDLHIKPGKKEGEPTELIKTEPQVKQLRFNNELLTGSPNSGDQTYIYTAPYANSAYVRGTAPAQDPYFYASGSVPDPALFAANSLQTALQDAGIEVSDKSTTYRLLKIEQQEVPKDLNELNVHKSPKLKEINYWFLDKSINLYGEHLIKTIAREEDKTINTRNGVKVEVEFWKDKGIKEDELHIADGSGLSPENQITTKALATVLYHVKQEEWYEDFYKNLPLIHKIRMKSGHIKGVSAYSGFIDTEEGIPLVFSFMVNNYSGGLSKLTPEIFKLLDRIKN